MTQALPLNDTTVIKANEAIIAAKKGDRDFTYLSVVYPVPSDCTQGLKTYHPTKVECTSCPLVVVCFCGRTNTPITTNHTAKRKAPAEKQRKPKAPKTMTTTDQTDTQPAADAGTPKNVNPFKAGSKPHQTRELFLHVIESGKDKWTTEELEQAFASKGLVRAKTREERPNLINRQLLNYVAKTGGKAKNPGANHAAFYGLVTAEGAKPNYTFTFNIEALQAKVEELKASTVQPSSDEDEDDDE